MNCTGNQRGVIFLGSLAHRMLVYVHQNQPVKRPDLLTAFDDVPIMTARSTLQRLAQRKHLFMVGLQPQFGTRPVAMYAVDRSLKWNVPKHKPIPQRERDAAWKARRKVKVPSVFEFRGTVSLT